MRHRPLDNAPWHILLIEHNAEDCADMRQMLLRGGNRRYHFSEARFGAEGVRMLLSQEGLPVDCVLLDYALPDMDAPELLAALCRGTDMTPCPVVVITGTAVEEGQSLLSAGAQDYIGKRWTCAESLTRAVENAVDRYALQRERRHANDALRHSEERFRALFNSIDAGFAVIEVLFDDADTATDARYLQVNPAFARHTGLEDVEGRTLCGLVPGIEPLWLNTYASVATTGEAVRMEQYVAPLQRWFDICAFRLGAPQARQVAVLFSDTTERKNAERALIAARATADAANRAKSDFLLNMSHELRSPLSSILGFAQLIEHGKPAPTPAQQDSVQQILQAGWYLLGLINEILDLTAIESGQAVTLPRVMSMVDVLNDCQAMIAPQALAAGIRVGFRTLAAPCLVRADPVRTKQVLINLLTNAIKYNRAGGQVAVRCTSTPGQPVRVSVDDTGQGLSAVQLAQLFEPFDRLGQERGSEPGTGIGLVICKRLVAQMGGRMGADSTVGEGSCFWFELDAASDITSSDITSSEATASPSSANSAASGRAVRTVLCIEPADPHVQQIEAVLAWCPDICLLSARDVDRGMAMARTARPDAILMAAQLLDTGGVDAGLLLARDPATARIPLIALGAVGGGDTAVADGRPQGAALPPPAGFIAHLALPLQRDAFIAALEGAFSSLPSGGARATV